MSKKRIVYGVVMVMLLNMLGPVVASAKITDVAVDHWAYHSVNTVVNEGYLTFFEDGTFQGSRAVDRYTLASVVARLLDDIEVGRLRGSTGDLSVVRELSLDFEQNLARWYASEARFREDLQQAKQNAIASEERLSRVVSAQVNLEEKLQEVRERVNGLQNQFGAINTEVGQQSGDLKEKEERLGQMLVAVEVLQKELTEHSNAIDDMTNWMGEKDAVFAILQNTDSKMSREIDNLKQENHDLEKDLNNLSVLLQWETKKRTELTTELSNTKAELRTTKAQVIELEDFKRRIGSDASAQENAALIREQRLERRIKEIEDEFDSYQVASEKKVKSAKTMSFIAIALAAVGAVLGFMPK